MRFNERIEFFKESESEYDPTTGEYKQGTVIKEIVPCFSMDIGIEESMKLFGNYEKDRKQIYLRQPLKDKFEKCLFHGKTYKIIQVFQNGTVFYIEGDDRLGKF